MLHFDYLDVKAKPVDMDGASDVDMRLLIGPGQAPNFYMRVFEVRPGGHTPFHVHEWEHENFILDGEGTVVTEKGEKIVKPGDVLFIPGGEKHQFQNNSSEIFRFMCLIPA